METDNCETQENIDEDMVDKRARPTRLSSVASAASLSLPPRALLKNVAKLFAHLIIKLWRWASSFVAVIFFLAWFYGGILPYAVGCVAVLSLIYHFCDTLLYQPETPVEARLFVPSPTAFGLPFEAAEIHTKDRTKLHSYLILQPNSRSCVTVIFFHGNAGNIGHRLENAKQLFKQLKCNILLLEYRGYGHSEGSPSEDGLYSDAQAAYDFVDSREDLDSTKIILFGRSLGGAVAIDLASRCDYRDRVTALIVENTFLSVPDLAPVIFPFKVMRWIPRFFYKNKFENYRKLTAIVCPVLFLSGMKDELIPPKHMESLHRRCCSSVKRFSRFPEGSHNDTWRSKDYLLRIQEFVDEVLSGDKNVTYGYSDDIV